MFNSLRRSGMAAMAAAIALASCGASVLATQPALAHVAPRPVKAGQRRMVAGAATASRYGRKGAGITMAQQQRSAAKKRSVAHNRRHHR